MGELVQAVNVHVYMLRSAIVVAQSEVYIIIACYELFGTVKV